MTAGQMEGYVNLAAGFGYHTICSPCEGVGASKSAGVAIHWRKHLATEDKGHEIQPGRAVALRPKLRRLGTFTLVSIYGLVGDNMAVGGRWTSCSQRSQTS